MDFKISLKAARVNAKLTQGEAAKALGVSAPTLASWEQGVRIPRADYVERFVTLYGIPPEFLCVQK